MKALHFLLLAGVTGLLVLWALTVGSDAMPLSRVLAALEPGAQGRDALVIQTVRLPRVLAGLAVGAALATAGSIMQAVTRNPLADTGLLGINAGAAFAVVLMLSFSMIGGRGGFAWIAFLGAALASALVHSLGSAGRRGATPLRLTLAGIVIGSFLMSLTSALLIFDGSTFEAIRIWTAGSLSGVRGQELGAAFPWIAAGLAAALLARRQISVLAMGDQVARGLGLHLRLWWSLTIILVALLAGSAVSLAGPVGFVGLMVPHAVRLLGQPGYGAGLPFVMIGGAGLVVLADALPRAAFGVDVPVGIALAAVGAPVLIWLARGRAGLPA